MTNKVGFLVLFGSVLLLTACSGKAEKTELTSQTSEISTTSTTEIELKPEEQYASIIEKFEKMTTNGNDALKSAVEGTETQEAMVMNYVAQIKENGQTKKYAFYDINNDKTQELLIGDSEFILAIYTLKDRKPVFVKGAGTGGGSMRSSLTIYKDGTLQYLAGQGTDPNWEATSYQLKDGKLEEIVKKDFKQFQGNEPAEVLSISSEKVDFKQVTWNDFKQNTSKDKDDVTKEVQSTLKVDISSVFAGDVSSIEGNWTNSRGETVTITSKEIKHHKGKQGTFQVTAFRKNPELPLLTLNLEESNPYGPLSYVLIPAGNPAYSNNGESDATKDRLIEASTISQSAVISPESFFYR